MGTSSPFVGSRGVEGPGDVSEPCAGVGDESESGGRRRNKPPEHIIIMNGLALPGERIIVIIIIGSRRSRERHKLIGLCAAIDRCP